MPNPRPGESRDDFLDRCIPEVVAEGREPDQAVAMCIAYYEGEKDKAFNIKDENRIEYWKAFDRRRVTFENKYTRAFTRAFKEQLSIYEDAYTINDLKRDISTKPIEDAFVSLYTEVGDVFARNSWAGLKKLPFIETKQQPDWIERMIQAAKTDASARIVGITETTRKQVNAIIVAGLEEGLGVEEIKRRIIGTTGLQPLNGTLQQRARRIARTEIVSASNKGSLEGALSTNLPFQKQWLSTPDNRTRDSHAEADGQTVDKTEKFRVRGEELEYPGDPRGSAGNVINCRCTQIYVTGDTVTSDQPQITAQPQRPQETRIPDLNDVNAKYVEDDFGLPSDEIIELAKKETWQGTGQGVHSKIQGFDGLPTVLDDEVFDSIKDNSKFSKIYRGIYDDDDNQKTIERHIEDFKRGKLFHGRGLFGDGSYFANESMPERAIEYASGNRKNVIFALIDKSNFKMGDFTEEKERFWFLQNKFERELKDKYSKKYGVQFYNKPEIQKQYISEFQRSPYGNFGSYMTSRGYDGYTVRNPDPITDGRTMTDYTVILNRTKLRIRKTSGI